MNTKHLHFLDTCICIPAIGDIAGGKKPRLHPDSVISSIVLAELLVAGHKHHHAARRLAEINKFIATLTALPFDANAAAHYGDIRAHLEKIGQPIGTMDLLIAAHARSLGATLVTLNDREFKKVPGLKILAP